MNVEIARLGPRGLPWGVELGLAPGLDVALGVGVTGMAVSPGVCAGVATTLDMLAVGAGELIAA